MKKSTILGIIGITLMFASCILSLRGHHICFDIALIAGGIILLVSGRMRRHEKDEQKKE